MTVLLYTSLCMVYCKWLLTVCGHDQCRRLAVISVLSSPVLPAFLHFSHNIII